MNIICNGTALEVDVAGSGEPLLIIHGFTGSALAMKPLSDRLPGRKIIPDLIGHGRSESPASRSAYHLDAGAQQLASLLEYLDATAASGKRRRVFDHRTTCGVCGGAFLEQHQRSRGVDQY